MGPGVAEGGLSCYGSPPMASTHERLEALEHELEARGADGARLELVRRARNFKRSWVEMAEGLAKVRSRELHLEWGYEDFYSYCQMELLLTKSTVDKLTGSYQVVRAHAPQVLHMVASHARIHHVHKRALAQRARIRDQLPVAA